MENGGRYEKGREGNGEGGLDSDISLEAPGAQLRHWSAASRLQGVNTPRLTTYV